MQETRISLRVRKCMYVEFTACTLPQLLPMDEGGDENHMAAKPSCYATARLRPF